MASNDLEVLDPAAPVEKVMESNAGHELDRRQFFAALGVAGVAAGAALLSTTSADAQQPNPGGYAQVDVLNFLLNVKYLKATLYSYATQGADLPGSSYVTLGTGQVFNQPKAKVVFTGTNASQITDIFNEMYYDELNQLIAFRAQLGAAAAPRQTMNLLGTGTTTTANLVYDPTQLISLARLLEDLSASAFAAATVYLTGTNLQLAAQALASDGQHAGLIRLITIQNNIQYQGTQYASYASSNTAQTALTFSGVTTAGSNLIYASLPTPVAVTTGTAPNIPAVGNVLTGIGIPLGAGAVITSVNYVASPTFLGLATKSSAVIAGVLNTSGLVVGQPVTGTNVGGGSYIKSIVTNSSVTLSVTASGTTASGPTGYITSGSPTITGVSSVTGLTVGQPISGTGIPATAVINAFDGTANTITMSAAATLTPLTTTTGFVTTGSTTVTNVNSLSGFVTGQPITGAGIQNGTTVQALPNSTSITLSLPATAPTTGTSTAFTGFVTNASKVITGVVITSGGPFVNGQQVAGPGIPSGTTVASFTSNSVTLSANATATSVLTTTATTGYLSNVLTGAASTAGFVNGASITGTFIPSGTTITGTTSNTITLSQAATSNEAAAETVTTPATVALSAGGQLINTPATEALTTTQIFTVGQSQITIAGTATASGANPTSVNSLAVLVPDNLDVEPGDPGVAATSAGGPSVVPKTSPAVYQGFFNTAGAGTTSSTSTPQGFAFARTFQQVLAVLYGYNSTNSIISTQNYQGGFYPVGVSGPINSAI
jgi:hypothetical protein